MKNKARVKKGPMSKKEKKSEEGKEMEKKMGALNWLEWKFNLI